MSQLAQDAGEEQSLSSVDSVKQPREHPSRMRTRIRLRNAVAPFLVFLLFLAVSVGLLINVWRAPLTHINGTADALQTIWFMSWPPFALTHHQSLFESTYMNYPAGIDLLWNTSAIGPAILLWPVTTAWNAVLSYNVVMTVSMALAGVFSFVAIRRYVPRALPALAGAAVYAFSPYMIAHVSAQMHSVVSAVLAPLVLLLLDELLLRQRLRPWLLGVLLALLGVFQFFTHVEAFATELMAAVLLAIVLGILFRSQVRARWPYVRRALVVAVPLTAALLAYPVYVQLLGPNRVLGAIHEPDLYATDLLNVVVPDGLQFIAPDAARAVSDQFTGNASEWNGYLGIPLLIVTIFTLVRYWRVPLVRVAGVLAGVITLLSLGPHLHVAGRVTPIPLPWWIGAHIPLARDVLPARLMVYVYLAVAVLLAFALSRLLTARAGPALAAAAAAVTLIPLIPALPLRSLPVTAPAFFTTSSVNAIPQGAVVLAMPWTGPDVGEQTDALVWAAESHMRFRLIGGYFLARPAPGQRPLRAFVRSLAGTQPPGPLTPDEAATTLALLRQNDVGVVLLDKVPQQAASRRLLTRLLGSPPRDVGGASMWLLQTPTPR